MKEAESILAQGRAQAQAEAEKTARQAEAEAENTMRRAEEEARELREGIKPGYDRFYRKEGDCIWNCGIALLTL